MDTQNFTTSITVNNSPEEVFNAIINVREWWSGEFKGDTAKLGDEFTYQYKDMHITTQKVTELIPGKKVVWHVISSQLNFVKDKSEWNNTDIIFEISQEDGKTKLQFTHIGLTPEIECYSACSQGWSSLININLKNLIISGKNQPDIFA